MARIHYCRFRPVPLVSAANQHVVDLLGFRVRGALDVIDIMNHGEVAAEPGHSSKINLAAVEQHRLKRYIKGGSGTAGSHIPTTESTEQQTYYHKSKTF